MESPENSLTQYGADHIVYWVVPIGENQDKLIDHAEGVSLYTKDGREILDATSQLICVNLGYKYKDEIADAAAEQMRKLPFLTTFWGYTSEPLVECSQRLSKILQPGLDHYLYTNGGGESTETALQLARKYWRVKGTSKYKIISLYNSYHGVYFGSGTATGVAKGMFSHDFAPLVPGFVKAPSYYCYRCQLGLEYPDCGIECARQLEKIIDFEGEDSVAAFIAEPMHGTAGMVPPPPEYWPMVRDICTRRNVLLIADEVMTGFGRTGKAFATQHWDVTPDMMCLAKGITTAYLPFGAVAMHDGVWETFKGTLSAGPTYSGHPVCAAVACKVMEIYERDGIFAHAAKMGEYAQRRLEEQLLPLPVVAAVSGMGMQKGIEVVEDKDERRGFDPSTHVMAEISDIALARGLFVRTSDTSWSPSNRISFCPPLVSTEADIDRMVDIVHSILSELQPGVGFTKRETVAAR